MSMLFDKQYILTENVVVETRYRTETSTDPETGETTSEEVPYDYYICYVTLENFDLSHVPVYIMDEEKLSFYALYMSTLGNRPDLFSGSQYPNASTLKPPTYYDVPPGGFGGRHICRHAQRGREVYRLSLCVGRQLPKHQL